ncbi:MAG: PhzF family phenazine biosynthesis protein [Pirellulaceae bacterium]|nr:PhzF family phenazine biosynthesis protein [Pirellulaceae bacterium]
MPAIFQVDAFTCRAFSGNPAAVCLLKSAADVDWMQNVAAEMNLAETAFVFPDGDRFQLRWFTPTVEVDLCGHATLATAHVLWETKHVAESDPCVFQSNSGELRAERIADQIQLDFPISPVAEKTAPPELLEALGVPVQFVGMSQSDFLVEVDSAATVRALKPDIQGFMNLGVRGIIVTSRDETNEFDFISRFFAPAVGVDEDSVTGSAHCALGHYWMEKLKQSRFNAWQASPRGGGMQVSVEGDRIKLMGQAVTVFRGEMCC